MMADGSLTDIQACSDVLVPESLAYKGDNFALALREPGDFAGLGRGLGGWLWPCQITEHAGNHRGFKPDLTSPHLRDSLQECLHGLLLTDQPQGTMTDRLPVDLGVAHASQDKDTCVRGSTQERRNALHRILPTQIQVKNDDIRLRVGGQHQRVSTRG